MRFAIIAASGLTLMGCASNVPSVLTEDAKANLINGKTGAILTDISSGDLWCQTSIMSFQNMDTGEIVSATAASYGNWVIDAGPGMVEAEPGFYRLIAGSCNTPNYTTNGLVNVDSWFTDFEVKAGELTYFGTIRGQLVQVQWEEKQSAGDQVTDAVLTLGLSLLIDGDRQRGTFPAYEVFDQNNSMADYLNENHPDLADLLVSNPPAPLYTPEGMRLALNVIYAPNEDGTLPTKAQVAERRGAAMRKGLQYSLLQIMSESPENTQQIDDYIERLQDRASDESY